MAACLGATWIAGGVVGTIELLAQSLRTGGIILIGEPYWRQLPPTEDVAKGCLAGSISDFLMLPERLASFGHLNYDVVEMVLADQDGWDRYEATKWLTMCRWLEANPDDEFAKDVRAKLTSEPECYAAYTREYLGAGVCCADDAVMRGLPGDSESGGGLPGTRTDIGILARDVNCVTFHN